MEGSAYKSRAAAASVASADTGPSPSSDEHESLSEPLSSLKAFSLGCCTKTSSSTWSFHRTEGNRRFRRRELAPLPVPTNDDFRRAVGKRCGRPAGRTWLGVDVVGVIVVGVGKGLSLFGLAVPGKGTLDANGEDTKGSNGS